MSSTPRSKHSTRSTLPWRTSPKNRAPTSLSLVLATPEVASPLVSAVTYLPPVQMTSDSDTKTGTDPAEDPDSETQSLLDHSGVPQQPPSTTDAGISPASSAPDATHLTSEAPRPASGPTAPPQSRSWFASLSRRGSSNGPLNELAEQPPPSFPSEHPPAAQPAQSTTIVAAVPSPSPSDGPADTVPANLPVSEPETMDAGRPDADAADKLIPRKRAWFTSSSSSSSRRVTKPRPGDEPSPSPAQDSAQKDPPVAETPQLPTTNIIPPTPPRTDLARVKDDPQLAVVPVPIPAARKWFSQPSSFQSRSPDPEARAISPVAGPQEGVSSPRTPSSVDDQVPRLPSAGASSDSDSSPVMLSANTSPNLSSLNPSASRFSLSIPFLGRAKVPLDRAMSSAQTTDIRTEPDASSAPSRDAPAAEDVKFTPEIKENSSVDCAPPTGPNSETTDTDGTTVNSSWWGLVGWRPATSHMTSQAQHPPPITPLDHESVAVATNTASGESDIVNPNTTTRVKTLHGSEFSAETTQGRGSSWLAPWSWYGQSTSTLAPGISQSESEEASASRVEADTETPKTAEAEAEAEVVSEAPIQQSPASTTHVDPTNPIQSSIALNIYGWASLFSSKSLLAKRITDTEQREEDQMEVMEIDDGDDERTGTDSPVETPEARVGKSPVVREMQLSKLTSSVSPRSPSPSPKPKPKPDDLKGSKRASVSPAPSKGSGRASPRVPPPPNLVLPTWDDTFLVPPRSTAPRAPADSALAKTVRFVSGMLFAKEDGTSTWKGKARSKDDESSADFGRELPRIWDVIGDSIDGDDLKGCKRVVVIGIHGWFPGAVMRTVLGEPTGTSNKFVTMMCQALEAFQEQHLVRFEKVTQIPLEGEGTISKRVEKLYTNLTANREWMNDLHLADAILVATHSQGSIVSTHLLDRLIRDRHIKTSRTSDLLASASAALAPGGTSTAAPSTQRVCCLALCGIHLGPLRYLSSSSLLQPYIQYFESAAAKELFEFQSTNSEVSKVYVRALRNVVDHGVKMVFIASLNDQVVPLYSGLFTAASHPLILRALYIDGDAYHTSDFLSNLLVLLLRVMNAGLSDSGLLTHLSEATAGSLNGIGHSKAYEELATYTLAVNYLFMTNQGSNEHPELVVQPFEANTELNDYEIPWALRDLIANEGVAQFFANDIASLRNAFPNWHPKTAILRDIKRKLQPIQRLNTNPSMGSSPSKL